MVMTVAEAEEKYSVFISIQPELYKTGVNWCWQVWWYNMDMRDGSYSYGDNGEHPTRESAEQAAIQFSKMLVEVGSEMAHNDYRLRTYKD